MNMNTNYWNYWTRFDAIMSAEYGPDYRSIPENLGDLGDVMAREAEIAYLRSDAS